ncbi:MAG: hypothetical protein JO033_04920 [Acidobacteriaceae bacterium]|nr:hypothetical protein [Acidobacteriaceae bacterium]MBV9498674.1 hypothetical protein [Acidobacteriaceae bacterium]
MKQIVGQAYYGIPKFAGALFRATRVPSVILLVGFIVIPLALATYVVTSRSTLPLDLFAVGVAQFQIESDPTLATRLPPYTAHLMQTMTTEQKETGKVVFESVALFALVLAIAIFWWIFSFLRFVGRQAKPQWQ